MKRFLIIILGVVLFSNCTKDSDIEDVKSLDLKNRLILSKGRAQGEKYLSDSIFEHYENGLIIKEEHFIRPYLNYPLYPYITIFEYDESNILQKEKTYVNLDTKEIIQTRTYYYNEDYSIKKIVFQRTKPSNIFNTLNHNTKYFEYNLDTVRRYTVDHLDNDKVDDERLYVIKGNLDTIINLKSNYIILFDEQNDIQRTEYLGDPVDVWSWQTDYSYGSDRTPLINDFFGSRLNSFLIPEPIVYYSLERTSKYLEKLWMQTHRTNETIRYEYLFESIHYRPSKINRAGTFYSGDEIRYFYEN